MDQELVNHFSPLVIVVVMLLTANVLAKALNKRLVLERGYQSHLASMRLAAAFALLPAMVFILGWFFPDSSAAGSQLSGFEALLLYTALCFFSFGLITLRRWTIYVLGSIWTAGHIALIIIIPIEMGPNNPAYVTLLVLAVFSWAAYSQLRHGYQYLKSRWGDYR